ncbi:MAG: peptide-methionine (S)-S-oxide reductase, partial [Rhizobium pusense]|nr:peptide-methionine (S)-S-oxide reductase [Agrobacterium pusense]
MFLFDTLSKKTTMPTEETALPGREEALVVPELHFVNGRPLKGPYPDGLETIYLGMGCFWGAERLFWNTPGVWVTAVGYAGGFTRNPTYQETTTGQTGHAEVVKVVYDPAVTSLGALL